MPDNEMPKRKRGRPPKVQAELTERVIIAPSLTEQALLSRILFEFIVGCSQQDAEGVDRARAGLIAHLNRLAGAK